jgi:NarL family two-component system response regulator LiaR
MTKITVVIVDDHPIVRNGLQSFLGTQADIDVVGSAASALEGERLARELQPDIVLMDIKMPEIDGVAGTSMVLAASPRTKVIVLSTFSDSKLVLDAITAGAMGYLVKDMAPEDIASAIRSTVIGGAAFSPTVAVHLIDAKTTARSSRPSLPRRELEVLRHLAEGLSNRQIAREMGIGEKTVKAHCARMFTRLGVSNRTQAALWARKNLPAEPLKDDDDRPAPVED